MKFACLLPWIGVAVLSAAGVAAGTAWADDAPSVTHRDATILSEGVRLHADLYYPDGASDVPLPAIIMSHGWGGTAAMLRRQASDFAAAGYLVIAFDYRGWGQSDSRVILTGPAPDAADRDGQRFTAEVKEIREVVDPMDQAEDIFNVVHWAMGEPQVDKQRVGLWGTSFSGGLVVYVAARDPRIKALVSQVGAMGWLRERVPPAWIAAGQSSGTGRAHGTMDYPPPGAREVGNLRGGPILEKFLRFSATDDVSRAGGCAMLFIVAGKEELFDNRDHAALAFARATGPKKYVEIPGIAHYGVYGEAREQATRLAIDWFDEHLKH
ncbi:MAG: alpha/beta fold hydrolase [Betaproteobacteria bacterium]